MNLIMRGTKKSRLLPHKKGRILSQYIYITILAPIHSLLLKQYKLLVQVYKSKYWVEKKKAGSYMGIRLFKKVMTV